MTAEAVTCWKSERIALEQVLDELTEGEWALPSACDGWRVRDVVAHLGASARAPIDPLPEPVDAPAPPEIRERQHDVLVNRRREWSISEVMDEYRTYVPRMVDLISSLQSEPTASTGIPVPGLGTYPAHSLANAQVFDYYCHLRHDLLGPAGPLKKTIPAAAHETVYAAVYWMMLGLPQMQGDALNDTVTAPVTFRLTGPGESEWTVHHSDTGDSLVVEETGGGDVVVTSTAHAFVAWGTARRDWRADCALTGHHALATPLLDALNII